MDAAGLGLRFPVTTYYDGQGFLAPKALGLQSAEELSGARICVQSGTASEGNRIVGGGVCEGGANDGDVARA